VTPVAGDDASVKLPGLLLVNIETVLLLFPVIRSIRPSPLTSTAMTAFGLVPTAGDEAIT
jgi:hypothetical protein